MTGSPVLRAVDLTKSFAGVRALDGVSFEVGKNEIVGLVGDNGAGKSTLINLLTGVYRPDRGFIEFEGEEVRFRSPADSRRAGIEPVYQTTAIVDLMNLWRNFYLGREITRGFGPFRWLDRKQMAETCMKVMREVGVNVRSAEESVAFLSGGERQSLCIGRCMTFDAKVVLLDEPTNALSITETRKVLDFARSVRDKGMSEIIVDHNIHHIYPIVDRFVVLRRGRKVAELIKDDVTPEDVIEAITMVREEEGHVEPVA